MDITTLFREFARLDVRRLDQGLGIEELERWATLKGFLDQKLGRSHGKTAGSRAQLETQSSTRRSARRVATRLNCSYGARYERREAVVSNLSTGGVFIRTDTPLAVDTVLRLFIRLEETGKTIEVEGVVVSNNVGIRFELGVRGMGVRFSRLTPEVVEEIGALYSRELELAMHRAAPKDSRAFEEVSKRLGQIAVRPKSQAPRSSARSK